MTASELWNDNMKIKEALTQRHQYTVKNVSVDLTIKNAFSENKKIYIFSIFQLPPLRLSNF